MFVGTTFFAGEYTISPTITSVDKCGYIGIKGCILDELYVSNDTSTEETLVFPTEWTYDTIMHATYDEDLNGGNVDFDLSNTSHIAIKRREKGEFNWKTISVHEINVLDDFKISGIDYTARSKATYEYATVPYLNGVAGNYNITEINSIFDGIFISEIDKIYGTIIEPGSIDTTRNVPSSTVELLHNRYPKYVSNSKANYDTGTASGVFIELDHETCELNIDNVYKYRKEILDFLADRKPKILKHFDGRMWLINVTGNITDTMDTVWQKRTISFDFAETGDCESEKAMYRAGLSNVTSEWWNS